MIRNVKADFLLCLLLVAAGVNATGQQHDSAPPATSAPAAVNTAVDQAIDQQRRSLFAQRASLKRQVGETNFAALAGTTFYGTVRPVNYAPMAAACPPLESTKREDLISAAASRQAIEPDLLRAVMHRESGFHPCAVSTKGAMGLMQLMPATLAQFHVADPFDPAQSVYAGAAMLRTLLDRYQGDLKLALAAYNAGSSRIENSDPESYPAETKNYIADILAELGVESTSPAKPIQ